YAIRWRRAAALPTVTRVSTLIPSDVAEMSDAPAATPRRITVDADGLEPGASVAMNSWVDCHVTVRPKTSANGVPANVRAVRAMVSPGPASARSPAGESTIERTGSSVDVAVKVT